MVVGIYQFFILFSYFSESGELFDHVIGGLKLGAQVADLPLVHFYDPVQVLELCLDRKMCMLIGILAELSDQSLHLLNLLLVLLLLQEKGVLFEQEKVHSVQSFEVVIGCVDELVAVVHDGKSQYDNINY